MRRLAREAARASLVPASSDTGSTRAASTPCRAAASAADRARYHMAAWAMTISDSRNTGTMIT